MNRLIIISVDALNSKDFEYIKNLPTFGELIKRGSTVTNVMSVYPSITYPSHTSISTGVYPNKHKIYNNEIANPYKHLQQDWNWHASKIKSPTIFDYALKKGYKVGTIFWPVMAKSNAHYNMPEIFSPDSSESFVKLFFKNATLNLVPSAIKYSKLLDGIEQPQLDNFAEQISLHVLKHTNFTAIHFTMLDAIRHHDGLQSKSSKIALKMLDRKIYNILKLIKDKGEINNTTIAILGDHGTHTFQKIIEINSLFKQHSFIKTNKNDNIVDYKAYANTCGGSCHIHLNSKNTQKENEQIYDLLRKIEKEPYIKKLFEKEELKNKYHLEGDFTYVLEANDEYTFRNTVSNQVVRDKIFDHHHYNGDHGYLPEHEDLKTMLIMVGKGIKKNFHIENAHVIDFGPTIAKSVNINMKNVDGKILDIFV